MMIFREAYLNTCVVWPRFCKNKNKVVVEGKERILGEKTEISKKKKKRSFPGIG